MRLYTLVGPRLPKGPTNRDGCANLDELPVPVLIQREAALPAQLLEPAGWESGQRSGEEEAGSALGHGELFRPRQAHEQSRQTVSPASLLYIPSAVLLLRLTRERPDCCCACVLPFQNGDFIPFRSTNRAVWACSASNQILTICNSQPDRVELSCGCILSDQGIPRSSLGVLLLDEISLVRPKAWRWFRDLAYELISSDWWSKLRPSSSGHGGFEEFPYSTTYFRVHFNRAHQLPY